MLKLVYFLRILQTSPANNSRIFRIKNAKFSGYSFYMNTNIYGDFQICITLPLNKAAGFSKYVKSFCYHQALKG